MVFQPMGLGMAATEVYQSNDIQVVNSAGETPGTVHFVDGNLEAAVRNTLNKFSGDLTTEDLAGLTSLIAQDASITDLTGLESAVNLRELNLMKNQVKDLTPLLNLTNLQYLELSNNQIDRIDALQKLNKLWTLGLFGNQIEDLTALEGLSTLRYLWIGKNLIKDISSLTNLINLESLGLEDNRISDISALASQKNLSKLIINNNEINNISSLQSLTNLQELYLSGNRISDISALSNLVNLQVLYLYSNSISNIAPLAGLDRLENLWLGSNLITDPSPLANLGGLRELWIYDNRLEDISSLGKLLNLDTLVVSYNPISDLSSLKSMKQLKSFHINRTRVTDFTTLNSLLEEMPGLQSLGLGNLAIKDLATITALSKLPNLSGLNLPANGITDISPLAGFTQLTWLSLNDNQISDISSLEQFKNMESLYINNNRVTDISSLAANSICGGLGTNDFVDLRYNNLDLGTSAKPVNDIKILQNSGCTVDYQPQTLLPYQPPNITGNLSNSVVAGIPTEFQMVIGANSDQNKLVRLRMSLANLSQKDTLSLQQKSNGTYNYLSFDANGVSWYGPPEGFFLRDAAIDFQALFKAAGHYKWTTEVVWLRNNTRLASTVFDINVAPGEVIPGSDDTLRDLRINNQTVAGFTYDLHQYNIELPAGTVSVPEVIAIPTDAAATATVINAAALPGTTSILVQAEDGSQSSYAINFTVAQTIPTKSSNANLADLRINGQTIPEFSRGKYDYNLVLSPGTTSIPVITAIAEDPRAAVTISNAAGLPGVAAIIVTAEDATKATYKVAFSVEQDPGTGGGNDGGTLSSNNSLSELKVDGQSINDFESGKISYDVLLAAGTTAVPRVTATAAEGSAQVAITNATGLPGTTILAVTAQDGTLKIYTVNFKVAQPPGNSSGGGGGGGSVTVPGPDAGNEIVLTKAMVNRLSVIDGHKVLNGKLDEKLVLELLKKYPRAKNPKLIMSFDDNAETYRVEVPGKLLVNPVMRNVIFDVKAKIGTSVVHFTLPEDQLGLFEASGQLGVSPGLVDINLLVGRAGKEQAQVIENYVLKHGLTMLVPPIAFKIEGLSAGKSVEISHFSSYLTHSLGLELKDEKRFIGAEAMVGMALCPDGNMIPVPTQIKADKDIPTALLKQKSNAVYTVIVHKKSFMDIEKHWAEKDISLLAGKRIIAGINENVFAPDLKITRAQFAALITKATGLEPELNGLKFKDVGTYDWFNGAVGAAVKEGIVKGYPDGTFRPNALLTREEAAVMAVQVLEMAGMNVLVTQDEQLSYLSGFSDRQEIAAWAREAVSVAVKYGIMKGYKGGKYQPAGFCTRAEMAVIIKKVMDNAAFI